MPATEGLKPLDGNLSVPIDPNVVVPAHVRAAAEAAEAAHREAYTQAHDPATEAQQAAAAEAERARQAEAAAQTTQQVDPVTQQPVQQDQHPPMRPEDQNVSAEEWRHRFLSMKGRYDKATQTIGSMEQQMTELGQELVRTQNMLTSRQAAPVQQPNSDTVHNNLITEEDRANYGDELIDLARRAAMSTVNPELEQLREENRKLTQRVQNTGKRELFMALDQKLPEWRQINQDQRFKLWLRLPNVYTGQIRGNMLKAAVDGAEAPKVLALFKDFLAEAAATGQLVQASTTEQQPQLAAPHTPAMSLEQLAAPGRARPASGDSQVPSEKPFYSRADISKFFDEKRRGLWANRIKEAQDFENDLTAAQREGRIRG
jgi:hypothetical protein